MNILANLIVQWILYSGGSSIPSGATSVPLPLVASSTSYTALATTFDKAVVGNPPYIGTTQIYNKTMSDISFVSEHSNANIDVVRDLACSILIVGY